MAKTQAETTDRPAAAGRRLPPAQDLQMRIGADGTWYYRGTPINRPPLVRLFASALRREDDGSYWLVTPVERGRVTVDDVPFTAVELVSGQPADPAGAVVLRTNIGDLVTIGPDHPIRVATDPQSGEPRPYVRVRDGLEALILRPVFYELVELGEERAHDGETVIGLWSSQRFFPLGPVGES